MSEQGQPDTRTWQERLPEDITAIELMALSGAHVSTTAAACYRSKNFETLRWSASIGEVLSEVWLKLLRKVCGKKLHDAEHYTGGVMPQNTEQYTAWIWEMTFDVGRDLQRKKCRDAERNEQLFVGEHEQASPSPRFTLSEPLLLAVAASFGIITPKELEVLEFYLDLPSNQSEKIHPPWDHIASQLGITVSAAQERDSTARKKLRWLCEHLEGRDLLSTEIPEPFYHLGVNPRLLSFLFRGFLNIAIPVERAYGRCSPEQQAALAAHWASRMQLRPGDEPLPGFQLVERICNSGHCQFWIARGPEDTR